MRIALHALTDELRRLKTAGVKTVAVSSETVAALRRVMAARVAAAGPGLKSPVTEKTAVRASGPRSASLSDETPRPVEELARAPETPTPPPTAPAPIVRATAPASRKAKSEPSVPALPPAPNVALPPGDKGSRRQALVEQLANDATCQAQLRSGKKVVFGVGSMDAKIMFIGDAPGPEEEIAGEPFMGPSGQLLTRMIQAMGLKREDVYLASILNWRPQLPTPEGQEQLENRPPTADEMRYCLPYLQAQIDLVDPDLLVALGSTAAHGLLGSSSFKALGEVRGKWHTFASKPLMVTYHPSYILRNPSNRSKRMIWEDLLKVMERAALPLSEKQLSFFL